jgi:RNA polymerase sigma-70 factor, ECF subfamily
VVVYDFADGHLSAQLSVQPEQLGHMDFEDFRMALSKLPSDQREALILVGAEGFSYEEAAVISGCAVGTIKSRVNRARARLSEDLGLQDELGYKADRMSDNPIVQPLEARPK